MAPSTHFSARVRILPLTWLMLVPALWGQTPFMTRYTADHPPRQPAFLEQFPYAAYLDEVALTDFDALEADRIFLQSARQGDAFLYYLGEAYLAEKPLCDARLNTVVDIGETYLGYKPGISPARNELYRNMGYFFLGKAANYLSAELAAGRRMPRDAATAPLMARLSARSIYVTHAKTPWQKLKENVGKGNFTYVGRRAKQQWHTHWVPYLHLVGTHTLWPLFVGFSALCLLVFLAFRRKRLIVVTCCFFAAGPLLLGMAGMRCAGGPAAWSMRPYRFLHGRDLTIDRLQNAAGRTQGHAVWLPDGRLRATYLAEGDVTARYNDMKRGRHVFLATAGGFTNHLKQPEGLTLQDGRLINGVLQPNRHGLVLMDGDGRISAFNLKDDHLDLPDGVRLPNPMTSLTAYAGFIRWCESHRATVFQTQLVVYRDRLLIDPEKAVKRFRERRLLALVHDRETGDRHHVLLNITEPHMLAPLSAELHALLGSRGQVVDALLNLDVGLYDILDVFDEQGRALGDVCGTTASGTATNLIVYLPADELPTGD